MGKFIRSIMLSGHRSFARNYAHNPGFYMFPVLIDVYLVFLLYSTNSLRTKRI